MTISKREIAVIDLAELLKSYRGKWVAVAADKKSVLSYADTFDDLIGQIKDQGNDESVVVKVPDEHTIHLL